MPSRSTAHVADHVGATEAVVAIGLAAAYAMISVPFPELIVLFAPQLLLLLLLAGTLAWLGHRFAETAMRAVAASVAALTFAAIGLVLVRGTGTTLTGLDWFAVFPYTIGAGVGCGTWVARPETHLSHIMLRVFEGATATVVLYALAGLIVVTVRG